MRCSFILMDGVSQVVLTPENAAEKAVLALLHDGRKTVTIEQASFRQTRGGYIREFGYGSSQQDLDTMLVLRPAPPAPMPEAAEPVFSVEAQL